MFCKFMIGCFLSVAFMTSGCAMETLNVEKLIGPGTSGEVVSGLGGRKYVKDVGPCGSDLRITWERSRLFGDDEVAFEGTRGADGSLHFSRTRREKTDTAAIQAVNKGITDTLGLVAGMTGRGGAPANVTVAPAVPAVIPAVVPAASTDAAAWAASAPVPANTRGPFVAALPAGATLPDPNVGATKDSDVLRPYSRHQWIALATAVDGGYAPLAQPTAADLKRLEAGVLTLGQFNAFVGANFASNPLFNARNTAFINSGR